MQINALLRQVHHHVTLANDEADHKLEKGTHHLTCRDPIKVGDKVLLHRPQSATAQSSHLPWVGDFTIIKTNDMMSQVQNEKGDTAWIHRAHIRRLAPRLPHLCKTNPLPPPCNTNQLHATQHFPNNPPQNQNMNPSTSSPHDNNTIPTLPPVRTTRGNLPTRFRDFVMI